MSAGVNHLNVCINLVTAMQKLEAIQRWVGDMSRVTLNFDLSKIPFVHF